MARLLTIKEASDWASNYLNRRISTTNISYLIQYGKVKKHQENGSTLVSIDELKQYYESYHGKRQLRWKQKLGEDLNWTLSFDHLREKDTTKHVHRLHPYKGKFIPQLVEYFIDDHTDKFKFKSYFKKGDVILDPFSGSGTTLVQANELGLYSIGIDISRFNNLIAEVKLLDYQLDILEKDIKQILNSLKVYETDKEIKEFENELYEEMKKFNDKYFPSPSYKYRLYKGEVNEERYGIGKAKDFLAIYNRLVDKYGIKLKQAPSFRFLDKWYSVNIRKEIDYIFDLIKKIKNTENKKILAVLLSRTIRSCRATKHYDLGTLKYPQVISYYCYKHKKICKPIFSIKKMLSRYAWDTLSRLSEFKKLKKGEYYSVITADSRKVDIFSEVKKKDTEFYKILKKQKVKGIFTSPPYVGQIDYHEQHAYAYDLFGFKRRDDEEIGPLYKGKGREAQKSYVKGISEVLINCKKYMVDDFDVFIVANDRHDLYPEIAKKSGMRIAQRFKRPVLNRTERDKSPYSEIIFHFKNLS